MSTLALIEVQKGLYSKLSGDGVLMGMVTGIFDAVPQKSTLPYVVIGDGAQNIARADGADVTECRLVLHVWTDASGRKTAHAIMNRIHALLHLGSITVNGFAVAVLRSEQASVRMSDDATLMHGTLSTIVTVEEV